MFALHGCRRSPCVSRRREASSHSKRRHFLSIESQTMYDRELMEDARRIVREALPPTPQIRWPLLDRRLGAEVWVKHENHTALGAVKLRGGLVYSDSLRRREPDCRGVISATRGNHGQSVGFAARRNGLAATIVVPHGNSS